MVSVLAWIGFQYWPSPSKSPSAGQRPTTNLTSKAKELDVASDSPAPYPTSQLELPWESPESVSEWDDRLGPVVEFIEQSLKAESK